MRCGPELIAAHPVALAVGRSADLLGPRCLVQRVVDLLLEAGPRAFVACAAIQVGRDGSAWDAWVWHEKHSNGGLTIEAIDGGDGLHAEAVCVAISICLAN